MEVQVQLAYKRVIQYDSNWKETKIYNSVQECLQDTKIGEYNLRKSSKEKKKINGFYYVIEPLNSWTIVKCANCEKEFNCQTWRVNKSINVFCCLQCQSEWKIKNRDMNCICDFCGKKFHKKLSRIEKCSKNYCSQECANKDKKIRYSGKGNHQYGLKGNKNCSWKSDERISVYGYKMIRCLNHPFKNGDDFVFEHRLIAEKYLLNNENSIEIDGVKYLKEEYVVHHLDFNRLNNAKENLLVMLRGTHSILHKNLKSKNDFIEYCNQYNLDFQTVYNNHIYNVNHYKYIKK